MLNNSTENKEKIAAISELMANLEKEATSEVIQEERESSIKERAKAQEDREPIAIPKAVGKTAETEKGPTNNDVLILLIIHNFSINQNPTLMFMPTLGPPIPTFVLTFIPTP